jgi:hypothetical protein
MHGDEKFVTFTGAAQELGVARATLDQLVRRGDLTEYTSRLDRRGRFVRLADVRALQQRAMVPRREIRQELSVA